MKKVLWVVMLLSMTFLIFGCTKKSADRSAGIDDEVTTENDLNTETISSEMKPEESSDDAETTEISATQASTEAILTVQDIDGMEAGSVIDISALEHISLDELFHVDQISDQIFDRIDGVSYGEGCVVDREDLRYIRILYYGFDQETHVGEIISNKSIADDLKEIFQELYQNQYPIEKVVLVDEYDGDDNVSMADNNTSCFNFRNVPGSDHLSKHAYGRAIDVNPLYNPYINEDGDILPEEGEKYADRSEDNPYKIDENDLCYKLFDEHGFTWGGHWNSVKDYQHFQK